MSSFAEYLDEALPKVELKPMKTFKIIYTETSVGEFWIDAEDEDAAIEEFQNGYFDFSDMDIVDSSIEVTEV